MICYCGKEIDSSAGFSWQQCTYIKDKIVYAVCMHGIVCINEPSETQKHIEILEDLIISIQNEIVGYEPCGREKDRIEALEKAIEVLKEK